MSLSKARGEGKSHWFWVVTIFELMFALWTSLPFPLPEAELLCMWEEWMCCPVMSYMSYLLFGTGGFEPELAWVGTILQCRCTLEVIQCICYIWSLRLVLFLNVAMSCKNTLAVCPSCGISTHSVIVDALSLNRSKCSVWQLVFECFICPVQG